MPKYVVAVGNAFDGTRLVGPYDSFEAADRFAQTVRNAEWNIQIVIPVTEYNNLGVLEADDADD